MSRFWLFTLAATTLLLSLLAPACRRADSVPPPLTYPVTGNVVGPTGTPLVGGVVQFQSQADPQIIALGDVGPEGNFTLVTPFHGRKLPGTVAGPHQVTVIPPMTERQDAVPVTLREPYTVTPQENHFQIAVGAQR